jgi:hypothetical protein
MLLIQTHTKCLNGVTYYASHCSVVQKQEYKNDIETAPRNKVRFFTEYKITLKRKEATTHKIYIQCY